MKNKIRVLCPEYVPLENKGEEAIIRGTIDVLFPNIECEYHIVDNNSKVYYESNGIHVHPGDLFFSNWRSREFELGLSFKQIYSSICSLIRNGMNKFFPFWIIRPHREAINFAKYISGKKKPPARHVKSIELLKNINYIIAGHNGGLDEYACHIINELHKLNIPYGIFGSSMQPNYKEKNMLSVFEKTFKNSNFNIARNPIGYNWAKKHFPKLNFELRPDPAFGMTPISESEADSLIKNLKIDKFLNKKTIMITTAEPAPITRKSFDDYNFPHQKIVAHRKFLSDFITKIHDQTDFNILFLPHTIGPDLRMDDRRISEDVIVRSKLKSSSRVMVLKDDLSAKELKGLIKNAHFLLAERVHSIIGAIGVGTPFMCLGSQHDLRLRGILKIQMELGNNIYYLSYPKVSEAYNMLSNLLSNYDKEKNNLKYLNKKIKSSLFEVNKNLSKFFM